VAGAEAVLVFVSDLQSSLPRPEKELGGFAKVTLEPAESRSVSVRLDRRALSFWEDRRGRWLAEKGKFSVMVAASAADVRLRGEIELKENIEWLGL
jgi:beta-glucosidase